LLVYDTLLCRESGHYCWGEVRRVVLVVQKKCQGPDAKKPSWDGLFAFADSAPVTNGVVL